MSKDSHFKNVDNSIKTSLLSSFMQSEGEKHKARGIYYEDTFLLLQNFRNYFYRDRICKAEKYEEVIKNFDLSVFGIEDATAIIQNFDSYAGSQLERLQQGDLDMAALYARVLQAVNDLNEDPKTSEHYEMIYVLFIDPDTEDLTFEEKLELFNLPQATFYSKRKTAITALSKKLWGQNGEYHHSHTFAKMVEEDPNLLENLLK